jgi:plastocyanin
MRTTVFLLHGAGDTIIPSSETLWLAKDVPQSELKTALVSPALVHVDMGDKVTWQQQWQLVDFMAQVLDATQKLPVIGKTQKPAGL